MISIDFDPSKVSYLELLSLFWNNHEYGLTTRVKRQYASVIYYHSDEQKRIAEASLENERVKRTDDEIITEIQKCGIIYTAEEWVQRLSTFLFSKFCVFLYENHAPQFWVDFFFEKQTW